VFERCAPERLHEAFAALDLLPLPASTSAFAQGAHLDTIYAYDTSAVGEFFKGRLKSITRNGETIAYTYDRFGRMLQDGTLTYGYDKNGRRTSIAYPNGVSTATTYDLADRPVTMTVSGGGLPSTTNLVTAATYKPSGPLTTLTLGNGLTENRFFDSRYYPDRIEVPGKINWDYAVNAAGNVTQIADGGPLRTYGYRDYQYFLTQGDGPWGTRNWSYDKIGNRLTEVRSGVTDTYTYVPNGANRNPKLQSIALGGGAGTRTYGYDAIGDETRLFQPNKEEERIFDDAGRLTRFVDRTKNEGVSFRYDGRGFLREAKQDLASCTPFATTATYSSEGTLMHRRQVHGITAGATAEDYVFYFAGRPVGQLTTSPGPVKVTYLTTDHLGTPILSTASNQSVGFVGGLEPFGRDWNGSAQSNGVFLRFPGSVGRRELVGVDGWGLLQRVPLVSVWDREI
jgi:YD repeat-containing protein